MKTHIIERNQIFKNNFFSYWCFIFVLFLIFIIPKIAFSNGEPIIFEKEFSYIAIFFGITGIFLFSINLFYFKKTGILTIESQKMKIKNNGLKKEIELSSIDKFKIKRIQGNIYKLLVNDINLEIALDKSGAMELKKMLPSIILR